jgi:hypothetical protein
MEHAGASPKRPKAKPVEQAELLPMKDITPTIGKIPEPANANMLAVIARAAADPNVNVEKMRELLNMQKEIVAEEARTASIRAFIALQNDLPPIGRDGRIEIRAKDNKGERTGAVQQSTPYATFNNIMTVLKPLLKKHGFGLHFVTEPMANMPDRLLVKGILEHDLGHVRTTTFPLGIEQSGSKNPVQGWGSTMSYGKRYCTIALLNIISEAPEDRDTDGNPNKATLQPKKGGGFVDVEDAPKLDRKQAEELGGLMAWSGLSEANFCAKYGIDKPSDLPADLFTAACKAVKDYYNTKQNKAAK